MDGSVVSAWLEAGDRQLPLAGKTFSLGRAKDNNVVFTSTKVSRRHALVHAQGGAEFSLVDLGSSNGTHLNGRRVIQPVALQDGDLIQIGEQSLVFRVEDALAEDQPYVTQTQVTVREVSELRCWFLLLDIVNFVRLSGEISADELARIVGSWLSVCQSVVEQNGGTLSKFLGDGMLVYWNEKTCEPPSIAKALDELRAVQERRQPAFRWALHFGNAIFGAAALATGELSALSQDLNFLFRMERLAAEQEFSGVISEVAQQQLGPLWRGQFLGNFSLKGFEGEYGFFA